MRQWMLRITAYADRLLDDLDPLDWPDSIKTMQRNWIGRVRRGQDPVPDVGGRPTIEVFTTRPDTLFGATFLVLAPEHPLVDVLVPPAWPAGRPAQLAGRRATRPAEAVAALPAGRRRARPTGSDRRGRRRPGSSSARWRSTRSPATSIPIFVADYVLMGYGTGAIMAVPGQDERDWEFAEASTCRSSVPSSRPRLRRPGVHRRRRRDQLGTASLLNGLDVAAAKTGSSTGCSEQEPASRRVTYKLRDWLFSRQRYWGEPFPIVYDEDGVKHAAARRACFRVALPDMPDFSPTGLDPDDATSSRCHRWPGRRLGTVELDLGDGDADATGAS